MRVYIVVILFLWTCLVDVSGQNLKYVDAKELELLGKGTDKTETLFQRLPAGLKGKLRDALWNMGCCSSGLALRFRTNSTKIVAEWKVTTGLVMNHMSPTGIQGLDLYRQKNGTWCFVHTGRPDGKKTTTTLVTGLQGGVQEYMLYLPLYDGIESLRIGVDSSAQIGLPELDSPRKEKPVVFYGTSITQGACASRAGMSYTNQLSRMLDREIINLGFSGNGRLDLEIADMMKDIDASCFVLDCVPNCEVKEIEEKCAEFIGILRKRHPDVPIVMIENPIFPHMLWDQAQLDYVPAKNRAFHRVFESLKVQGYKRIYYVMADRLTGKDGEATVDGIHLTDLGLYRYAQAVYPVLKKVIK